MDAKLAKIKAEMDLTRTWMHVDMDAFFAAVEELDEPTLVCLQLRNVSCTLALAYADFPLVDDQSVLFFLCLNVLCRKGSQWRWVASA